VDIEVVTPTIKRIQNKFLNDFEIALLRSQIKSDEAVAKNPLIKNTEKVIMHAEAEIGGEIALQKFSEDVNRNASMSPSAIYGETADQLALLTLCWSAKEAMYKWYGNGAVDFKNHMHLIGFHEAPVEGWTLSDFLFQKEKPAPLVLRSRFFGDAVLTYVIS
jgi:4'-phosphopantetheinyl transferase EntD